MAYIDDSVISAADGTPLAASWFLSDLPARSVVLVGGATAVPARFYRSWATDLADCGYDVLTFDYRGIAGSRRGSLRGYSATMQDWGRQDLQAALDHAFDRAKGRPVLFFGHSFGGQALGLVRGTERLAGGITVGTQLGYYGHWPIPQRYLYAALWYGLVPAAVGAFGYLPGRLGIGEDLPAGVAREWARWCRSPGYLVDHVPDALDRFEAIGVPMQVVAVSDDDYAPEAAVSAYAALFPRATLHCWTPSDAGVEKIGHFGFFRRSCRPLWDQAKLWLDRSLDVARVSA